ncbi:hydroxyacid dehydrogenase [Streptomyces formicae]|uniref:Hydroxyacid dehydrogenase n=1 Tax=Streptomyces formicae TaxID=1616117 RepID=A0ABY3WY87_9ACTN|nr:hydroxyacid dehydrogenase [Streptomyces formicae]
MTPDVRQLALPDEVMARLRGTADVVVVDAGELTAPHARPLLAEAEILLSGWGCPAIDEDTLAAAPRLQAVIHAAGTVKHHLSPAVWERGLTVSSAAGANAVPVAEYTLSMVQLAAKRVFRQASTYGESGSVWQAVNPDFGLHGRTVGVVGASHIGRLVLERLGALRVRLLVADPYLDAAGAQELGAELRGLDKLLAESDIVTLHAPLLSETTGLLDERRLALLRDGAILINTARGALVDTEALVPHCVSGRIDAVLDVTEPEPLPAGHPLIGLPNVLITPHVAGAMGTEVECLGAFAVDEIERFVQGRPLLGAVSAEDLSRIA